MSLMPSGDLQSIGSITVLANFGYVDYTLRYVDMALGVMEVV